jgi:hypothetical protein
MASRAGSVHCISHRPMYFNWDSHNKEWVWSILVRDQVMT